MRNAGPGSIDWGLTVHFQWITYRHEDANWLRRGGTYTLVLSSRRWRLLTLPWEKKITVCERKSMPLDPRMQLLP